MNHINQSIKITKLLNEVAGLLRNTISKNFDTNEITPTQGIVIRILYDNSKITMSELSNKIGLSSSTMCGIINRMENKNIVERSRSNSDRRVVHVELSKKFKEQHKDFHAKIKKSIQDILNQSSDEEQNTIIDGLSALKQLLERTKKE